MRTRGSQLGPAARSCTRRPSWREFGTPYAIAHHTLPLAELRGPADGRSRLIVALRLLLYRDAAHSDSRAPFSPLVPPRVDSRERAAVERRGDRPRHRDAVPRDGSGCQAACRQLCYWSLEDFRRWANEALTVVRELWCTFPGSGDLAWRADAMKAAVTADSIPCPWRSYAGEGSKTWLSRDDHRGEGPGAGG